jgi:tetratricopeptide (TPR) repeat protein
MNRDNAENKERALVVESSSLAQQGIAAYKAGNKEEAVRLLSQALRQNRQDEDAWLYLGAALDDPVRKRQAFQQVLQINPDNEKAKNALTRLDQMQTGQGAPAASARPAGTAATPSRSAMTKQKLYQDGIAIPFDIEGAPEKVTVPYLIEHAKERINQAIQIYVNRNYELIVSGAQGATMWDVWFTAGVGIVAVGVADLVGRLIGWPLSFFPGGLGGLFWPFVSAIVTMAATAAGFAGGLYASRYYLQSQGVNVSLPQHGMYYALIFLPLLLANAVVGLVTHALGFLNCLVFPLLILVGFALSIYSFILLKEAFDRVYGSAENRGLITAAISIGGWIVGLVVAGIVLAIFNTVFSAIFHYRFV